MGLDISNILTEENLVDPVDELNKYDGIMQKRRDTNSLLQETVDKQTFTEHEADLKKTYPKPYTDYAEDIDSSKPTIATGVGSNLKTPSNDYTDIAKVKGEIPDRKYAFVNPNLRNKQVEEQRLSVADLQASAKSPVESQSIEALNQIALDKYNADKNFIRRGLYEQFRVYGFNEHTAWGMTTQNENFTPGIGEAITAEDARLAFNEGTTKGTLIGLALGGATLLGAAPLIGDVGSMAARTLLKRIQRGSVDAIEARRLLETMPFHKLPSKYRKIIRNQLESIHVYHGASVQGIRKFTKNRARLSRSEGGTGQGSTVHAFGLYFTDLEQMAETYKNQVSWGTDSLGSLYKLGLKIHPDELLLKHTTMLEQGGRLKTLAQDTFSGINTKLDNPLLAKKGNFLDPDRTSDMWRFDNTYEPIDLPSIGGYAGAKQEGGYGRAIPGFPSGGMNIPSTRTASLKQRYNPYSGLAKDEHPEFFFTNDEGFIKPLPNIGVFKYTPHFNEMVNNENAFSFLWDLADSSKNKTFTPSLIKEASQFHKFIDEVAGFKFTGNRKSEVDWFPKELEDTLRAWDKGDLDPVSSRQFIRSVIPHIPPKKLEKVIDRMMQFDEMDAITDKQIKGMSFAPGTSHSDMAIARIEMLDESKELLKAIQNKNPVSIEISSTIIPSKINPRDGTPVGKARIGYRVDAWFENLRQYDDAKVGTDHKDVQLWHNSAMDLKHNKGKPSSFINIYPELDQTFETLEEAHQVAERVLARVRNGEVMGGDFQAYIQAAEDFTQPEMSQWWLEEHGISGMKFLTDLARPGRKFEDTPSYNYVVWDDDLIQKADIHGGNFGVLKQDKSEFLEEKAKYKFINSDLSKKLNWWKMQGQAKLMDASDYLKSKRKAVLGFNKGGLVDADREYINLTVMGT